MANSRSRELTKNTFIITLGRVSTQFISFLLLPLYTALLTKEEYGTVDLIATLVQLIVPVVSLMIDQGVFRYLLNCETEEERKTTVSSAFFLLLATSTLTVVAYAIISLFVSNQYKIWLLLILIATAFSNLFLQIARGLKKTGDYALGSFVCSASTIVLNVLCIAFLRMGATGMLIATFAGNAICSIFLFTKLSIGKYVSFSSVDKAIAKNELLYSVPLIPNQLSIWVMNSSDRLIVTFFLGTAANGILAVSHKFPAIYMTFFNIFLLAWHETGAIHYFDEDRDQFFSDMVKKTLSIFSTLCMAIIVALPIVFNWFVNTAYNEAYYNIPIYLVASLLNVVIGLLGVVYVATKKTTEIAKTTFIAAIINIVIHVALIKQIGLYAASISTLIGYLLTLIYRLVDTKKYLKIKYDIKQIIGICALLGVGCFVYYLNNKIVSLVLLPVFIIFAYLFNRDTIDDLIGIISEKTGVGKKKLLTAAVAILAVIVVIAGFVVYKKYSEKPKEIQSVFNGEVQSIEPEKTIVFADFGANDFTCTGLTYDAADNAYWIGDYGAMTVNDQPVPRVVEVDKNLSIILHEINLDAVLDSSANLQGVAYDNQDDALWLAVGEKVVEIDKDGKILSTIEMGKYSDYMSNGVCYSEKEDSLWVLCASKYLLHYEKDGTLIGEFSFDFADQDHIVLNGDYLYITVGADYKGTKNYICKVDVIDGSLIALYQTKGANSLEGICYTDGKFLITNDGLYHNDLIGKSYITIYEGVE